MQPQRMYTRKHSQRSDTRQTNSARPVASASSIRIRFGYLTEPKNVHSHDENRKLGLNCNSIKANSNELVDHINVDLIQPSQLP